MGLSSFDGAELRGDEMPLPERGEGKTLEVRCGGVVGDGSLGEIGGTGPESVEDDTVVAASFKAREGVGVGVERTETSEVFGDVACV